MVSHKVPQVVSQGARARGTLRHLLENLFLVKNVRLHISENLHLLVQYKMFYCEN